MSPLPAPRWPAVAVRFGIKGGDAAPVLAAAGLSLPTRPNAIVGLVIDGRAFAGRVLRLGAGEYLVESDDAADAPRAIATAVEAAAAAGRAAFVVERADVVCELPRATADHFLPQLTRFDARTLQRDPGAIALTQVAGIAVTLAWDDAAQAFRLWLDPGYRDHFAGCVDASPSAHDPSPRPAPEASA